MALRGIGPSAIQSFPLAELLATRTSTSGAPTRPTAPNPPWRTPAELSASLKAALSGKKLIDENATQLDVRGPSSDYGKLFALYRGLGALSSLATHAFDKKAAEAERAKAQKAFESGVAEVLDYTRTAKFEKLRLVVVAVSTSAKTTLGVPKPKRPPGC